MFTANPVVGMLAFWLICMAILGVVKTLTKQETGVFRPITPDIPACARRFARFRGVR